jgi:hypothetical protein
MIDFGLGGLIEKFEEYFGRRFTKFFCGVVAVSAICVGLGFIWNFIFPIYEVVRSLFSGTLDYQTAMDGLSTMLFLVFAVAATVWLINSLQSKHELRKAEHLADRFEGRSSDIEEMNGELRNMMEFVSAAGEYLEKNVRKLSQARTPEDLEEFIKEHAADPDGDLDKMNALRNRPTQGSAKATRTASPQGSSDD